MFSSQLKVTWRCPLATFHIRLYLAIKHREKNWDGSKPFGGAVEETSTYINSKIKIDIFRSFYAYYLHKNCAISHPVHPLPPALIVTSTLVHHSQYIYFRTVSSYRLLSTMLIQFKLVYGLFGQSNMHSTINFCPRPARKENNVLLHKRS